ESRRRALPQVAGLRLFDLDVLGLDERAVGLLLALYELAHLLGRARARLQAERDQARLELIGREQLLHFAGDARHQLARRAGRGEVADPGGGVVARQVAGLGERRELRHRAGALRGGDAVGFQPPGL